MTAMAQDKALAVAHLGEKAANLGAFTRAFARQNTHFEEAIQSLDSLNDQIVQFIFAPKDTSELCEFPPGLSPDNDKKSQSVNGENSNGDVTDHTVPNRSGDDKVFDGPHVLPRSPLHLQPFFSSSPQHSEEQRESLRSSMALMRRLLVDAQGKFRRMMEENKALASRIDGDIQTAHQEVSILRAELQDTNKRITQITNTVSVNGPTSSATPSSEALDSDSNEPLTLTNESVHLNNDPTSMGSAGTTNASSESQEKASESPIADDKNETVKEKANDSVVKSVHPRMGTASPRTSTRKISTPPLGSSSPRTKSKTINATPLSSSSPKMNCKTETSTTPPLAERESDSLSSSESDGSVNEDKKDSDPTKAIRTSKSSAKRREGGGLMPHRTVRCTVKRKAGVDMIGVNGTRSSNRTQVEVLENGGSKSDGIEFGKSQDADDEGGSVECDRCRMCSHKESSMMEVKLSTLEEQNDQLNRKIRALKLELETVQQSNQLQLGTPCNSIIKDKDRDLDLSDMGSTSSKNSEVASSSSTLTKDSEKLEIELKHAKDALAALKSDRKRLKAEKFDLLNQMKQLYGTLEDKEIELRDFIRNYEQRMRESDENLKQLVREREDSELEKWSILKHARDEAERSVALCAQLGLKEAQVKQLQEELNMFNQMRDKGGGYLSDVDARGGSIRSNRSNGYRSPSNISNHNHNGRESSNTPTPTLGSDPPSCSYTGGVHPKAGHRPSLPGLSRSAEEIYNSSGSSDAGSKKSRRRAESKGDTRSGGGSTWGSISRVFSRSKHRKSLDPGFYDSSGGGADQRSSWSPQSSLCASPLTEDSYTEKLKLLEEAQGLRMERWKASTVLAWLEITLGMPQYGAMCAENIKSGKILLELSDSELEAGLGISNSMHRRKLRLAIEEHRDPSSNPFPKIFLLTHTWVTEEWLPSLGLLCYADNFSRQLVDGRVLETLTKKDLEKSLGVSRKFHQVSIMHAAQLLRMVKFDKQLLHQRRTHSETMDVDPLVWTNQRFIKWAKSIDLNEYADNLRDSGVHGALVVLEPSFQADTMATALGIPASKNIIRRHLTTELDNLVQPARMSLEAEALVQNKRGDKKSSSGPLGAPGASGSLGRNFLRSTSRGTLDRPEKRRSSMRGSLTRALGLKAEEELYAEITKQRPNSTIDLPKEETKRSKSGQRSSSVTSITPRRSMSATRAKSTSRDLTPNAYIETMTVTPV